MSNNYLQPSFPPSKPQIWLYCIVKRFYPDAELDYYVDTFEGHRWIDIAIPSKMIAIEYNGWKFHTHKEQKRSDRERQHELENIGWRVITCTKNNVLLFIAYIEKYVEEGIDLPKR